MGFQAVMRQLCREPLSSRQWEQVACLSAAMSATDEASALTSVERFKKAKGSLHELGSVALYSNQALVARVLKDHFGIEVHDYLVADGVAVLGSKIGYPLLAHISSQRNEKLLLRALEWGADPNAAWNVDRLEGLPLEDESTISWVSECTRAGNAGFLKRLLPLCSPPSPEEQNRRLVALQQASTTLATSIAAPADRSRVARTIKLFAPGGAHALSRSFWDVPFDEGSLGVRLALEMVGYSNAESNHDHYPLLEEWLGKTAPEDGVQQKQLAFAIIKTMHKNKGAIPQWCVEGLNDLQAQEVFERAFSQGLITILKASSTDSTIRYGNSSRWSSFLAASFHPYRNLFERLHEIKNPLPGGLMRTLALTLSDPTRHTDLWKIPPVALRAFGQYWPTNFGVPKDDPLWQEVVAQSGEHEHAINSKNDADIARSQEHLRALGEKIKLSISTPVPGYSRSGPRL